MSSPDTTALALHRQIGYTEGMPTTEPITAAPFTIASASTFPPVPDEEWGRISFGEGWYAGIYPALSESFVVGYVVLFFTGDTDLDGNPDPADSWAMYLGLSEGEGGARAAMMYAMDIAAVAEADPDEYAMGGGVIQGAWTA